MTDIDEQIERNRVEFKQVVEGIRSDPDLNEAAKARQIDEAYDRAMQRHNELYGKKEAAITRRLEETRKAAFAPPAIPGADKATVAMSYRDAIARVSGTRDVRELEEVLEQADLTGDELLAHAVLYRGYQLESNRLVGRYLESRPKESERWDAFMDAAEEYNRFQEERKLWGAMPPRRPEELDRGPFAQAMQAGG